MENCNICKLVFPMFPLSNKLFVHKWINHFTEAQKNYIWTILNGSKIEDTLALPHRNFEFSLTITIQKNPSIKCKYVEDFQLTKWETSLPNIECESSKMQEEILKYDCSICGKSIKSKHLLNKHLKLIHMSRDTSADKFVKKKKNCDNSSNKILQDTNLTLKDESTDTDVHKLNEIEEPKPYFTCHECGKIFTRLKYFESHKKRHDEISSKQTINKIHLCNYCGKQYKDAYNLKIHLFIHTGDKPLKCDICGKEFVIKKTLTEHMYIHSGHKPFICEIEGCNKAFTHSTGKRQHFISVHSNIKRFECEYCQKRYAKKTHLK